MFEPPSGTSAATDAARTPGSARASVTSRRKNASCAASSSCRGCTSMATSSSPRVSKPGSMRREFTRLCVSSDATARQSAQSATCAPTSVERSRDRTPTAPPLPPFIAAITPLRDERSAGTSPNSSAVPRLSSSVNATTRPSGVKSTITASGALATSRSPATRTAHAAPASPSAPPIAASTRLSINSCRTSRPRLAPNASRTEISRPRVVARASSRFATFAQAMSSTSPTTPNNAAVPPATDVRSSAFTPRTWSVRSVKSPAE